MFISEHTSSGMSVNIDIELSILSTCYITRLTYCILFHVHTSSNTVLLLLFIIIISGTLYTHTAVLVKILYVLVVLVISPLGF